MTRIGLIVAVELDAVTRRYGRPTEIVAVPGYEILRYDVGAYQLFVLRTGAGQIRAAAATQFLITLCEVDAIFNFGVVGGLTEAISRVRSCLVDRVVHFQFDTTAADDVAVGQYTDYPSRFIPTDRNLLKRARQILPDAPAVTCASGDVFVGDPEAKRQLHRDFEADICEMEAAAIVLTCDRNKIPCLLIKLVADSIEGGADEYYAVFAEASDSALVLLDRILREGL